MYKAREDDLFLAIENKIVSITNLIDQQTQRGPTLGPMVAIQAQASTSQQTFDFEEVRYLNQNESHFFQLNNNVPRYYHPGWTTYEDFSYGNPSFQGQGASSFNYQGQTKQSSFKENILALLNETIKSKDLQKDGPSNLEAKFTNFESNQTHMGASMKNLENQIG